MSLFIRYNRYNNGLELVQRVYGLDIEVVISRGLSRLSAANAYFKHSSLYNRMFYPKLDDFKPQTLYKPTPEQKGINENKLWYVF